LGYPNIFQLISTSGVALVRHVSELAFRKMSQNINKNWALGEKRLTTKPHLIESASDRGITFIQWDIW
jgi:hypothetical protein